MVSLVVRDILKTISATEVLGHSFAFFYTDILLLSTRLITVYFQLPLQWKMIVLIKHHMGKKTITVFVQLPLNWRMILRY